MTICTNKRIGESIGLYETGALEDAQRAIFQDHLIECAYCYDQVYSIEPVMTAFRSHRTAVRYEKAGQTHLSLSPTASRSGGFRFWRPLVLATLLVLLGIALGILYLSGQNHRTGQGEIAESGPPDSEVADNRAATWQNIEVPRAPYVAPTERAVLRGSTTRAFDLAMMAYQQNDLAKAIDRLEVLSESETPDTAEANFYLGVSLLLVGRNQAAIAPLRKALQSTTGARQESCQYYLALAYLKNNQPQQALAEIETLIGMNGEHRFAAEQLKKQTLDPVR